MLLDIIFALAVLGLLIAIYKLKFSKSSIQQQIQQQQQQQQQQQVATKQSPIQTNTQANTQHQEWQSDSDRQDDQEDNSPAALRKRMRKDQKNKQKQQRKEAHQQFLQMQKQKREKEDQANQQKEKLELERKMKQDMIVAQLKAQEEKRRQQEFNKWKDMFSVEQEGQSKLSAQQQQRQTLLLQQTLALRLKKTKLTLLQDLSHSLKLPTREVVDKIKELEKLGMVNGIFDERGKYLTIQEEEWRAIKGYIGGKGRVRKTDIMAQCARLIKIPQGVEQGLLDLIKSQQETK